MRLRFITYNLRADTITRTFTSRVTVGDLMERDHVEDTDVVGMIILRWIFRKWYVKKSTG
jgi:hypothetical protein